jgi:RimJ/RimL family protein N-acetyltransferase
VPWSDHVAWLTRRLDRADPALFIAEHEGLAVATFRVDDDGELSYTVAPEHRGRGIASALLVLVAERFGSLRAEIKHDNLASIRAAEKAGHHVVLI